MKIYIAGKLNEKSEIENLEKIDSLCKSLGFDTFLPHRDVGILKSFSDSSKIFDGDIKNGFKNVDLVIADLNGLHIGAGTAWELGYAYAKRIPCFAIKTDESPEEAIDYLSAILISSTKICRSFQELESELNKIISQKF